MAATKADPSALVAKLEVEYPCSWSLENAEQRIRLCATGLGFLPGQHVYDILAEPILDYGQTVRVCEFMSQLDSARLTVHNSD